MARRKSKTFCGYLVWLAVAAKRELATVSRDTSLPMTFVGPKYDLIHEIPNDPDFPHSGDFEKAYFYLATIKCNVRCRQHLFELYQDYLNNYLIEWL